MKSRELLGFREFHNLPTIRVIVVVSAGGEGEQLNEGKWERGRFDQNIRIDQPTHGVGQSHAHVFGRKGEECVVVNLDGTVSHRKPGRLHKKDADALRAKGFDIPTNNMVEWVKLESPYQFLVE